MSFKDVFKKVYDNMFAKPQEPKQQEAWPFPKSTDKREPAIEKKSVAVTRVPKEVASVKQAPTKRKPAKIKSKK